MPVTIAAIPNQTKTLPGAKISSPSRITPTIHQVQPPSELTASRITTSLPSLGTTPPRRAGGAAPSPPNVLLAISTMPASEPISAARLDRQHQHLLVRRRGKLFQRLRVALRDEVVDRLDVALGDRLGDDLGRARLGLGRALARLGVAEGGFAAALGLQDQRLLLALGLQDLRGAQALRLEDLGALVALGLHLPAHRVDDVARRVDVLDLDAGDLDAPGRGRRIDDVQQAIVDVVALGEELVEIHAADDGADVGHGELQDGVLEPAHLVGGARRVEHLVEGDAVDADGGVVAGDHLLRRHVEHLLHHVHLGADRGR